MKPLPPLSQKQPALTEIDPFYLAAEAELAKGYVRLNLMADALAQVAGDETLARPLYLKQVALKLQQEQKIKALLQSQATPKPQPTSRLTRYIQLVTDYWYVLPLVLLAGALLWAKPVEPLKNFVGSVATQLGFGQHSTAHDTATPNAFDPEQATSALDNQVAMTATLQQQYPALDPNHATYQAALAAQVSQLSQQFQQQGHTPEAAQQMAALSVLGRPNPAQDRQVLPYVPREGQVQAPDEPQAKPSASACEHKPVMSNQDYLNCGIQPPNSSSSEAATTFDPVL